MSKQIEELSKDLASGVSRRKALWRFFVAIGGSVFAGKAAFAGNGNSVCVQFCRFQGLEGRDFGQCVSASAHCPPRECALMSNGGQFICVPFDPES